MSPGLSLPVAYEDEELLILNKRSGFPSVPLKPDERGTAVEAALSHYPGLQGVGDRTLEPGLLHRLDTGTSGLLAFAKTQAEFERLKRLWRSQRQVRKLYRALVIPTEGSKPEPHTIEFPIAHSAKSKKRMLVLMANKYRAIRGKPQPAVTHILNASPVPGQPHLLDLTVEIETGVMHQIRAHLSAIGAPILGDATYGKKAFEVLNEELIELGSQRLWLHAWRLEIPRKNGEVLRVEAPLPEGWP